MRKNQADERRLPVLRLAALALGVVMALVALFETINALLGGGDEMALLTDAGVAVGIGLVAWLATWLARRGSYGAAAWVLVSAVAIRAGLALVLVSPANIPLLAPLYVIPIVLAQVLLSTRAGVGVAASSLLWFGLAYARNAGQPQDLDMLPMTVSAALLLDVLVASLVHVTISRMNTAVRRADQLLSASERARAEADEREERFRALAESSATGIVIHQDGHLVYANPHFFDLAQAPRGDVFGLSLWDFFDKPGVERLQAQLARRRHTPSADVAPEQLLFQPLKGGRPRWCEVAVAEAVFWGKPAIVATLLDVTDLVTAQLQVQRERDFSNNIINNAEAIIMALDPAGLVVMINPVGERLTGFAQDEFHGRPFWELVTPPERLEEAHAMFAAMTSDERGEQEITWLSKTGDDIIIAWRWVAQRTPEGEISSIIAIGLDVTHQRLLERQAMATERLRSLGQVSGGVAHDLNNMLAGIMGPADFMLLDETDPEKIKTLNSILSAAKRGAETVKRIQRFSQARTELDKQEFDLRQLVDDVVFTLKPRWRDGAQKQGIAIRVRNEVPEGLTVLASSGEIGNVLTNLIVNACEAMPKGGLITVSGRAGDQMVEFRVSDTGTGMSEETMAQIFHPFFSTKGADNSGLGLAVIRGIVLRHGGTIEVDSQPGSGTTFTVALPALIEHAAVAEAAPPDEGIAMDSLQVLIVDDMPDILEFLGKVVKRQGHEVKEALTGEAALDLLQAGHFDLLITDYGMEGISGPDLAERARGLQPHLRVVLMTGWDVSADEFGGFDGVLQKPFTSASVIEVLDAARDAGH